MDSPTGDRSPLESLSESETTRAGKSYPWHTCKFAGVITAHLRLDRLTLLSTGDRSVDIYSTLLREQQSLTSLIVDYRIHPSEKHPLSIGPDDLQKLHSISGGGAVLEIIHKGRKMTNVNIVVGGHKGHHYPSPPTFTDVGYSAIGTSPLPSIRRLRIDDSDHSNLLGPTLELLFPRLKDWTHLSLFVVWCPENSVW